MKVLDFQEFAKQYIETQETTAVDLLQRLQKQKETFNPKGWFLAECQVLDSSRRGERIILPYGDNNTFKTPPEGVFSPRGLASDMSAVIAVMEVKSLPT